VKTLGKIFLFPKHKTHPDQASFSRRFFAFSFDTLLIFLVSLVLYVAYTEIAAPYTHEEGLLTKFKRDLNEGKSVMFSLGTGGKTRRRGSEKPILMCSKSIFH
jgi:hypothetical protein